MNNLEQQFLKAYDDHSDAIFRHCYFRVFDRELAKELTQDAFMKTWNYWQKGEGIDNPRAFLYRVANNLVIDHARKKKEASLDKMMDEGFDPSDNAKEKLLNFVEGGDLIRYLYRLEPKYRQALELRYVEDLDIREIASALGETENNISVRIHRGLEKIREFFKENHA